MGRRTIAQIAKDAAEMQAEVNDILGRKPRTAFTTTTMQVRLNYDQRDVELTATNGTGGIGISMRYKDQASGVGANLTPTEARELAADLIARAEDIEQHPVAD